MGSRPVAARTSRVRIRARAFILPLHDPVRVAEDVAMVDQISDGRVELVIGGGYLQTEFAMFGKSLADRPSLVEEGIGALRSAWTGLPFVYRGRPARVGLKPVQYPHPPLSLGGSSAPAARRAARLQLGFEPTKAHLFQAYVEECSRLGVTPGQRARPMMTSKFLHISTNPEASWQQLLPHLLYDANEYHRWLSAESPNNKPLDEGDLRASGEYLILTPDECLARAEELGEDGLLEFHPLVGGLDPKLGWASLTLFAAEVMPTLDCRSR
ncbi:LLM class flavin-dependent oxidoreductase [Williamsia muralis]|uniref:LLM class flavin-dependent oxidoreductase n=1 Tax=Williamsia marianensis TaxID=85044 RepID=UPI001CB95DF6|nr:LLM class flavin-dependent oxidoreductase [Williamsia marianensis]